MSLLNQCCFSQRPHRSLPISALPPKAGQNIQHQISRKSSIQERQMLLIQELNLQ